MAPVHTCPVCGFPDLHESPRGPGGGGSYEICPSCGFQFGVSDDDVGHRYETWRAEWQRRGKPWSSRGIVPPPDWDPDRQLEGLLRTQRRGPLPPAH